MKKLGKYINEQNESVYVPRGLMIVNPMERGLRVVSFSTFIFDFIQFSVNATPTGLEPLIKAIESLGGPRI